MAPHLWPKDQALRAMARSYCAEMHSGFSALNGHPIENKDSASDACIKDSRMKLYMKKITAHPNVKNWVKEARKEKPYYERF